MSDFVHHRNLNYSCPDALRQKPDTGMVGNAYFHPKTRRVYRVTGFVWNSTSDTWEVKYSRRGCLVEFTRALSEFKEPRFIKIDKDTVDDEE